MIIQEPLWYIFAGIIAALFLIDLGVFDTKNRPMTFRKSIFVSIFYISIALIFGLIIYYKYGIELASAYYTGFLLEKAMSVDNIMVIAMVFKFFHIPVKYQHKVLFWGLIGVIMFRGIMIYAGVYILNSFSYILYIFAVFLILTGGKIFYAAGKDIININETYIYKFLVARINILPESESGKFIVKKDGKIFATNLLVALIIIETMDLVFAIDSIPAIFAITSNIFIIYSSNIFAILGLRALYFCLNDIIERFHYLKYSLALILILIGIKILIAEFIKIPQVIMLFVMLVLLIMGVIRSLI